jgi:hypothetical protein
VSSDAELVPTVAVPTVLWKDEPDEHDYPAAISYLTLTADRKVAKALVKRLRTAPIEHHKAKDLLRSSWLTLLPPDDPAVARDLAKVKDGHQLSPVLLIRGDVLAGLPMVIADGYHRMCASYHLSENEDIPCRIIDRGVKEKLR